MIEIFANNYDVLLSGAAVTVWLSVIAILAGSTLGLTLAFGLRSKSLALRAICGFYRSFWRGTPILVQLLILSVAADRDRGFAVRRGADCAVVEHRGVPG